LLADENKRVLHGVYVIRADRARRVCAKQRPEFPVRLRIACIEMNVSHGHALGARAHAKRYGCKAGPKKMLKNESSHPISREIGANNHELT
jgi:hypothetical protein